MTAKTTLAATAAPSDEELFSDRFAPKSFPFFPFETVGDKVKGFLVSRKTVQDKMRAKACRQYVIALADGEVYGETKSACVLVQGRMPIDDTENPGSKVYIVSGIDSAPIGSLVGVKFTEERESKAGFSNAAKILTGYVDPRNIRKDLVDRYGDNQLPSMGSDAKEVSPF